VECSGRDLGDACPAYYGSCERSGLACCYWTSGRKRRRQQLSKELGWWNTHPHCCESRKRRQHERSPLVSRRDSILLSSAWATPHSQQKWDLWLDTNTGQRRNREHCGDERSLQDHPYPRGGTSRGSCHSTYHTNAEEWRYLLVMTS